MHASSSCLFINSLALEKKGKKNNALHALTAFCHYDKFYREAITCQLLFQLRKI